MKITRKKITMISIMLISISFGTVAATTSTNNQINIQKQTSIDWSNTYGSGLIDWGNCIQPTSDGGYIISGTYFRNAWSLWYSYVYLLKIDENGNQEWFQKHGTYDREFVGENIRQTTDGGFIIVGYSGVTYHYDVYVEKTDSTGNMIWNRSFGDYECFDQGHSIQQTSDGGYILTGFTNTFGSGGDVWLIKLDGTCQEQWNTTFGGEYGDCGFDIQITSDGGFIIVGSTDSYGAPYSTDVWLIKTDANGNEMWNASYGGDGFDEGRSVRQTSDGGYIVVGCTSSYGAGNSDVWLLKIGASGNLEWHKTFGGLNDDSGYCVAITSDGGYFITGFFGWGEFQPDVFTIKTDSEGALEWEEKFDNDAMEDVGYCGFETGDGKYIVAGYTGDYFAETVDAWVIKFSGEPGSDIDVVISGGFGVNVAIANIGAADVTDLSWELNVKGGILGMIDVLKSGTIDVPAGETQVVSTGIFFGLGGITIHAIVGDVDQSVDGTHLAIYSIIK